MEQTAKPFQATIASTCQGPSRVWRCPWPCHPWNRTHLEWLGSLFDGHNCICCLKYLCMFEMKIGTFFQKCLPQVTERKVLHQICGNLWVTAMGTTPAVVCSKFFTHIFYHINAYDLFYGTKCFSQTMSVQGWYKIGVFIWSFGFVFWLHPTFISTVVVFLWFTTPNSRLIHRQQHPICHRQLGVQQRNHM